MSPPEHRMCFPCKRTAHLFSQSGGPRGLCTDSYRSVVFSFTVGMSFWKTLHHNEKHFLKEKKIIVSKKATEVQNLHDIRTFASLKCNVTVHDFSFHSFKTPWSKRKEEAPKTHPCVGAHPTFSVGNQAEKLTTTDPLFPELSVF